jgi:hypothetical protein
MQSNDIEFKFATVFLNSEKIKTYNVIVIAQKKVKD